MNKINSVRIINYRSCLDTEFELYQPLTVLIGRNGAGKTNILNALSKLKEVEPTTEKGVVLAKENASADEQPTQIVIRTTIGDRDIDIKARFSLEFDEYAEKMKYSELFYKPAGKSHWKRIEKEYFTYSHIFMRNG